MRKHQKRILTLAIIIMTAAWQSISAPAEETFDLNYQASSMEMPTSAGFKSSYQTGNPDGDAYAGVLDGSDGNSVLLLNNTSKTKQFPIFFAPIPQGLKSATIDFEIRLTDNTSDYQFQVSLTGVNDDNNQIYIAYSFFSFDALLTTSMKKNFTFGNDFRSFRMLIDGSAAIMKIYDLKTMKLLTESKLTKSTPSNPSRLCFGDGSSTVAGKVELKFFRVAFNRLFTPLSTNN